MEESIRQSAQLLAKKLEATKDIVATAESCTGGMIADALTAVPGASAWFDRGFVTYNNKAKHEMLGVSERVLDSFGAVSAETVTHMLKGVIAHSDATVAVAVSGIAGPSGALPGKPVGTVFIGWIFKDESPYIRRCQLPGNRDEVRQQATKIAIDGLLNMLEEMKG